MGWDGRACLDCSARGLLVELPQQQASRTCGLQAALRVLAPRDYGAIALLLPCAGGSGGTHALPFILDFSITSGGGRAAVLACAFDAAIFLNGKPRRVMGFLPAYIKLTTCLLWMYFCCAFCI